MTIGNVSEAKAELSALLALVERGEEVIIARAGKPIARLTLFDRSKQPRKLGVLKGKIWISEDFDELEYEVEKVFS